jgi:hypothetical protein
MSPDDAAKPVTKTRISTLHLMPGPRFQQLDDRYRLVKRVSDDRAVGERKRGPHLAADRCEHHRCSRSPRRVQLGNSFERLRVARPGAADRDRDLDWGVPIAGADRHRLRVPEVSTEAFDMCIDEVSREVVHI